MITASKLLIELVETVIDQACCAILELDCKAGKTNFLSPDRQFGTMIECVDIVAGHILQFPIEQHSLSLKESVF